MGNASLRVLAVSVCAATFLSVAARAATSYSITPVNISATAGETGGAFDVLFTNSGPSSLSIAGFSFEVSVNSPDIQLTGADYSTIPGGLPYIFAGNSAFQSFALPLSFCNIDGCSDQIVDAADVTADGSGVAVKPGASVNLGEVFFNVSPSAAGVAMLSFSGEVSNIANANNLSDPSANGIDVNAFSGATITIIPSLSTPEPSSIALMLIGVLIAVAGRRPSLRQNQLR